MTTALSIGTVVSLGGGTLFQTGGDGGWFSRLLGSDAIVRTANPRADTNLANQSDDTATARTIIDPRAAQEDIDSALARMASIPFVTADDAVAGAIAGDAAGMARLQAFMDRAGFDPAALEERSSALFDRVEAGRDLAFTRDETLQAARRIVSAAQLTAQSAFLFPAIMFDGYQAGEEQSGWDVGPVASARYGTFRLVDSETGSLSGPDLRYFSAGSMNTLLSDGADGFDSLRFPETARGMRLYAIAASEDRDDGVYPLPFGYGLKTAQLSYRVVDARRAAGAPWVSLAEQAVTLHGSNWTEPAAATTEDSTDDANRALLARVALSARGYRDLTLLSAQADTSGDQAAVLSVPLQSGSDGLALSVAQLESQLTTISGYILGPDLMPGALSAIAARAADFKRSGPLVAARGAGASNKAAGQSQRKSTRRSLGFLPVQVVDYPEALAGALAGTKAGTQAMAAYLDAAGGDLGRLEDRAMALIDGLEARRDADDFLTLADAANRVTEATAKAAATTYLLNTVIAADFDLPEPEAGWDFGKPDTAPSSSMTRAGSGSPVIIGSNAASGTNAAQTPMVRDFLSRVEGLRFVLPSTYYRVMMLVAPSAGTASPLGNSVVINGAPTRLRDLRTMDPMTWARLSGGSIAFLGGLESFSAVDPRLEDMLQVPNDLATLRTLMMQGAVYTDLPPTGQTLDRNTVLGTGERNAYTYAARAFVTGNGALLLDFAAPPEGGTIIGAAIVGESDPEPLAERLAERIAQLLGSTAPAAGFLPGDIQPSSGTFFAAAFNLPQQVAANLSSQTGASTGGNLGGGPTGGGGLGGAAAPGEETAGGETAGGETAGGETAGGETAGGETAGGETAGGETAGGETAGGETAGGETAGGETAGGETAGGETAGGETAGGETAGGETAGGETAGGETAGGETAGGETAGGETAGGETAGGETAGGETAGGETAGGETAGGETAGGETAGGETAGGEVILLPDAGGPYDVLVNDEFALNGADSIFNIGVDQFDIEWMLIDAGLEIALATGLGTQDSPLSPGTISFDEAGQYDIILRFTYGDLIASSEGLIIVRDDIVIPIPGSLLLLGPGLALMARLRRRRG
ncbi:MAG: hypothetical protein AAF221_12435 [Pseudomonadota bacterium]